MSEFMSYDPWAKVTTRNGLPGDEIISMLQKSIRRGDEKNALDAAYEMYISSPGMEEKLWRRLTVISVEDIGFGEPNAPIMISTLNQMRKEYPYQDGDRPIFFIYAIRYLCKCKKERSSDHIKCLLMHDFAHGHKPEVPEFALDVHTVRGRAMGRDISHFLNEASKVIPQLEVEEYKPYLERQKEINMPDYHEDGTPETPAFEYMTFQY